MQRCEVQTNGVQIPTCWTTRSYVDTSRLQDEGPVDGGAVQRGESLVSFEESRTSTRGYVSTSATSWQLVAYEQRQWQSNVDQTRQWDKRGKQ